MFRRVDEKAKPAPKDESIRKEAQLEGDLQSLGSAGNEEANIRFFEMLLDKGNVYDSSNRKKQPIEKKEELLIDTLYNNQVRNQNGSFGNFSFDSGQNIKNNDISLDNLITNEIKSEDESSEHISSMFPKNHQNKV